MLLPATFRTPFVCGPLGCVTSVPTISFARTRYSLKRNQCEGAPLSPPHLLQPVKVCRENLGSQTLGTGRRLPCPSTLGLLPSPEPAARSPAPLALWPEVSTLPPGSATAGKQNGQEESRVVLKLPFVYHSQIAFFLGPLH